MPLVFGDDIKINKISGPVSMHILKPRNNPDPKLKQEFPNLPLIILFGDIHLGTENMCGEEEEVKRENDTFKIYDVNFLKLFNDSVGDREKIDFYVEGGDHHSTVRKENKNLYPSLKLKNLFSECYINPRSTVNTPDGKNLAGYEHSKEHCKLIPKIRWQSGDIRFFNDPESKYKKFGATLERLINILMVNFKDKNLTEEDLKKVLYSFNKNPVSLVIDNTAEEKLDNLEYLITQLRSITGIEPKQVSKELEDILLLREGLIDKQMSKILTDTRGKLKQYILEYFNYTYTNTLQNKLAYMKLIIEFQTNFIKLVSGCLTNTPIDTDSLAYFNTHKKAMIQKYYIFIVQKYGIIVEIFTLCRIFKYLQQPERPIINIIYYGDLHIQNIYYFLTRISGLYDGVLSINRTHTYSTVITKSGDVENKIGDNRCIKILPHIDLNKLILEVRKNYIRIEQLDLPTLEEPGKISFGIINKVLGRRRGKSNRVRKTSLKKSRSKAKKASPKRRRKRSKPSPKRMSKAKKASPNRKSKAKKASPKKSR